MAGESDVEKTEPASPRRLEKAREEGDIPRSRELATCSILMAAGVGMWFLGEGIMAQITGMLSSSLSFEREMAFEPQLLLIHMQAQITDLLIALAPFGGLLVIVALASPVLIGGWLFSTSALQPKFSRMNPLSGLGRIVSANSLVELGKAIAKTLVVGIVAWIVASYQLDSVLALSVEPLKSGSAHLGQLVLTSFIAIVGGLVLIAMIDAPYQMWHHANKLKMSREEVRQESKESDGNPEIKAKIRQMQREMARRRMMSEVPTADVVVTNPTHYAVALKYSDGAMRAPKVVAKGADAVAAKIRELAGEHNVPLLESPALARALHKHSEIGDEIPEALYTAVAEILAYVFQLKAYRKNGGLRPEMPGEVEVPPQMDPLNPAFQAAGKGRLQ